MKRKLISYICLMAIFMEYVPVNALSNLTSKDIAFESLEEKQPSKDFTEEDDESNKEGNEDDSQGTESKAKVDEVDVEFNEEDWATFKTIDELREYWTCDVGQDTILIKKFIGADKNTKVVIPRELEGRRIELEGFGGNFNGITHFKVADGDENKKVKLRATNLDGYACFYYNGNIQYLDFSGLDANIINLDQSFRTCSNLKYLNLSGWNVENADIFIGMIYECSSLKYLNLSGWNVKSSANTGSFASGVSLDTAIFKDMNSTTYQKIRTPVAENGYIDVSNLEIEANASLNGAFSSVKASEIIGLETWKNTENIVSINNIFNGCSNLTSLKGIENWNVENIKTMDSAFRSCSSLKELDLSKWKANSLTSTNTMFEGCSKIETLDLTGFNMDNVQQAPWMFQDCTSLKEIKGTENWTLSNVKRTINMFKGCSKLNFIDLSSLNLPNNINITNMFFVSDNLTKEEKKLLVVTNDKTLIEYKYSEDNRLATTVNFSLDLNNGSLPDGTITNKSTEIYVMSPKEYNDLNNIDTILTPTRNMYDFLGWQASKDINTIFDKLTSTYRAKWELNGIPDDLTVPEDEWQKTRNREELEGLWIYQEKTIDDEDVIVLQQYKEENINKKVEIPREIDGKTIVLENLRSSVFPGVTHIRVEKSDKPKVRLITRSYMLDNAFVKNEYLKYIDFSGLETRGLDRIWETFRECSNLQYINLSGWNVDNITHIYVMFGGCISLKTINLSGWNLQPGIIDYFFASGTPNLRNLIVRDMSSLDSFKRIKNALFGYTNSEDITIDVSNLNILENETSLRNIFNQRKITNIIGLEDMDTSNIEDMSGMFNGCSKLKSLESIENWDVSNVTNMKEIFRGCENLTSLDLSKWKVDRVENIESMFLDCLRLESLDLSNWNTENVREMNWLFEDLTLSEIKGIENWDVSNATQMQGVFNRCDNLNFINLSNWRVNPMANMDYMFNVSQNATENQKRLLIVTKDERLKAYNYKSRNRIGSKLTFDAGEGQFNTDVKIKQSQEIFTIDPSEDEHLLTAVENRLRKEMNILGVPNKVNYIFKNWTPKRSDYSENKIQKAFEILNDTYTATWEYSMISVTVPIQEIPFQVVTNLINKKADPFIAATLKIQNNSTSRAVKVSVKKFTETNFTKTDNIHKLELVNPNEKEYEGDYWDNLKGEDAIKKMALGLYIKEGINGKSQFTKETPLWLVPKNEVIEIPLGILPKAKAQGAPSEAKLSLTAKHAKPENFIGGRAKGKFNLVFKFE